MSWSFRFSFAPSRRNNLDIPHAEILLSDKEGEPDTVRLKAARDSEVIKTASHLVIVGDGYPNKDSAQTAGNRWLGITKRVLATIKFGADFGDRSPRGG